MFDFGVKTKESADILWCTAGKTSLQVSGGMTCFWPSLIQYEGAKSFISANFHVIALHRLVSRRQSFGAIYNRCIFGPPFVEQPVITTF